MKYLFILLVLLSCNKKEETIAYNEPLKVGQCYRNSKVYIKVLKVYKHDSYQATLLDSNGEETTILDNPDLTELQNLDCSAYEDQKRIFEEDNRKQESDYKRQLLECIDEKLECKENAKKESSESN